MNVQQHYDGVGVTTRADRARGPLIELKRFHNAIKRDLLTRYTHPGCTLLDMCCGRGGDLQKWNDCRVGRVLAIDISANELAEARRRYRGMSKPGVFSTICVFDRADVSLPTHKLGTHHVVAAMFCVHYFFASAETLRTFLRTVSESLNPGGFFVGCLPDGAAIRDHAKNGPDSVWLQLTPLPSFYRADVYGREYVFALKDTVTAGSATAGSREYAVDFEEFVRVAGTFGLRCIESTVFDPPVAFPGHEVSRLFRTFVFTSAS